MLPQLECWLHGSAAESWDYAGILIWVQNELCTSHRVYLFCEWLRTADGVLARDELSHAIRLPKRTVTGQKVGTMVLISCMQRTLTDLAQAPKDARHHHETIYNRQPESLDPDTAAGNGGCIVGPPGWVWSGNRVPVDGQADGWPWPGSDGSKTWCSLWLTPWMQQALSRVWRGRFWTWWRLVTFIRPINFLAPWTF